MANEAPTRTLRDFLPPFFLALPTPKFNNYISLLFGEHITLDEPLEPHAFDDTYASSYQHSNISVSHGYTGLFKHTSVLVLHEFLVVHLRSTQSNFYVHKASGISFADTPNGVIGVCASKFPIKIFGFLTAETHVLTFVEVEEELPTTSQQNGITFVKGPTRHIGISSPLILNEHSASLGTLKLGHKTGFGGLKSASIEPPSPTTWPLAYLLLIRNLDLCADISVNDFFSNLHFGEDKTVTDSEHLAIKYLEKNEPPSESWALEARSDQSFSTLASPSTNLALSIDARNGELLIRPSQANSWAVSLVPTKIISGGWIYSDCTRQEQTDKTISVLSYSMEIRVEEHNECASYFISGDTSKSLALRLKTHGVERVDFNKGAKALTFYDKAGSQLCSVACTDDPKAQVEWNFVLQELSVTSTKPLRGITCAIVSNNQKLAITQPCHICESTISQLHNQIYHSSTTLQLVQFLLEAPESTRDLILDFLSPRQRTRLPILSELTEEQVTQLYGLFGSAKAKHLQIFVDLIDLKGLAKDVLVPAGLRFQELILRILKVPENSGACNAAASWLFQFGLQYEVVRPIIIQSLLAYLPHDSKTKIPTEALFTWADKYALLIVEAGGIEILVKHIERRLDEEDSFIPLGSVFTILQKLAKFGYLDRVLYLLLNIGALLQPDHRGARVVVAELRNFAREFKSSIPLIISKFVEVLKIDWKTSIPATSFAEWTKEHRDTIINAGGLEALVKNMKIRVRENATNELGVIDKALMGFYKGNEERIYAAFTKEEFPHASLPPMLKVAIAESILSNSQKKWPANEEGSPWYVEASKLPESMDKYCIVPGSPRDLSLVAELYGRCPVVGYEIKTVNVMYSEHMTGIFQGRAVLLEQRYNNAAFRPHWEEDSQSEQEGEHRKQTLAVFQALAKPYTYNKAPHVSFVPVWHGTNIAILQSLFSTGFANLARTDAGFFGKGIYGTPEAEYAHRAYSSGALLVNWAAVYSPFPTIDIDEEILAEKGNFQNYDAHFVPVYSPYHPNTKNYHACSHDQVPNYSELVVFESSQILPRYIVELQPIFPAEPSRRPSLPPSPSTPSSPSSPFVPSPSPSKQALSQATESNASSGLPTSKSAAYLKAKKRVTDWSLGDVCTWEASLGLSKSYSAAIQSHNIHGPVLVTMSKEDWQHIGVNNFGDLRTLTTSVTQLQQKADRL